MLSALDILSVKTYFRVRCCGTADHSAGNGSLHRSVGNMSMYGCYEGVLLLRKQAMIFYEISETNMIKTLEIF